MNVGKYVLKAFWECKKLLLNKSMLKQIMLEAQASIKNNKTDDDDSDGGTSSEEVAEPPTKVSKKELEAIIQDSPIK